MTATYGSPRAFRAALTDHLKQRSRTSDLTFQQLTRRFVTERFLARVFHDPEDGCWVLKGGAALLFRLPKARYSKDLDLHSAQGLESGLQRLRAAAALTGLDHLTFSVGEPTAIAGAFVGVEVTVTAYLGAAAFDRFPIDLSTGLHPPAADIVPTTALLSIADVSAPPPNRLFPLPAQIAEKVCAMYETHGETQLPSSRYRDLMDPVLIVQSMSFPAQLTQQALRDESARRGLSLPLELRVPHQIWLSSYQQFARSTRMLESSLHPIAASLVYVGRALNPLLSTDFTGQGVWDPAELRWRA